MINNTENKEISAIIPIDKYLIVIFIYWFLTLVFGFVFFINIMFLIFEFRFEFLITFPFLIVLTVICFNLSVFYSFGKEKIYIEKDKLIIERINQPIKSKTRRIKLTKIEKVSILKNGEKNLFAKKLKLQDYALEFNKTGKIELKLKPFETIKILNGIDFEEAKTIKYWIEMKIKELNIER